MGCLVLWHSREVLLSSPLRPLCPWSRRPPRPWCLPSCCLYTSNTSVGWQHWQCFLLWNMDRGKAGLASDNCGLHHQEVLLLRAVLGCMQLMQIIQAVFLITPDHWFLSQSFSYPQCEMLCESSCSPNLLRLLKPKFHNCFASFFFLFPADGEIGLLSSLFHWIFVCTFRKML